MSGAQRSPAQWFCLLGGALLLVRGAVGVALDPGFGTPGEGWHQLFHFGSGAALLLVRKEPRAALAGTLAFAALYGAIAVTGIVSGATVLGVIEVQAQDNVIHTVYTLAALAAGLVTLRSMRSTPRPA